MLSFQSGKSKCHFFSNGMYPVSIFHGHAENMVGIAGLFASPSQYAGVPEASFQNEKDIGVPWGGLFEKMAKIFFCIL